jgi:putative spermidine/putrescine transport system ATP-binding protein
MPELTDSAVARPSNGPVLRVRGLTKSYGASPVVDNVSFDLGAGEILTLLGPSGCGKSTTLRMIAGLDQPDAGEVWIRGRLVASPESNVMVPPEGRKVGLVFQSYAIWPHMTVAENIGYPLKVRRVARETIESKVAELILLVKLDGLGGRMPTELSGGQQQRVALARALVYEPDLLLLDEPLSNLDSVLRKEMRSQIKLLQSRLATTVLYVTHDQEEAMALSNRIAVMNRGRIEQLGPPDAVYEQPSTRFVRDFVGETIRLRGVTQGDAQPLRVEIGGGVIEAAGVDRGRLHSGCAVEVSMRPEDLRLQASAAPGDNCLAGRVIDVTYYGGRLECAIRLDGLDEPVAVNADRGQRMAPNDRVFLAVDRARVRVWPL